MRVTWGATRFVVLVGPYAIKVARVPVIRPFIRIWRGAQDGDLKQRLAYHDVRFFVAVWKYFGCGIISNRIEYRLSRTYGHLPLVTTHCMLFWGLVNVQARGEDVSELDVQNHYFATRLSRGKLADEVLRHIQFCSIGGTVLLADYGHPHLEPELARCH